MARSDAVWGIDIGNSSLKALRCRAHESKDQIVADAFDYIEYPKILTQPGAEPVELIADALKQFLSRNSVRGDRVAISVPGQNGLARFIKLPPVESKKIPDIVRYEAKQQIPFDLNDVVWDYQRMGGGSEEEGFALETEIGLFAMKRDQVFRALEPFREAGIEVDVIQLTPLALYNYMAFDQLQDLPPIDEYDPDNPPPSLVVLSLGTDATDLVVTNGYRVWQRSIPLGGNHFTKALTKELKLTFAKAEHLKRNATSAQDPKAVFQAMRPVFNDMLTEIQRSLGYFASIDRAAKIGTVLTLGNAMKLPGLRRYLAQSLGFEVQRVESFRGLTGSEVLNSPAFKDNLLSFGVAYGLALQGLGKSALRTNLLPKELVKDRLIREKKPWAVAAAAVLLTALTISFVSFSRALGTVSADKWKTAEDKAKQVFETENKFTAALAEKEKEFDVLDKVGKDVVSDVEGRIRWLELLKAIDQCLPKDPPGKRPAEKELGGKRPEEIAIEELQQGKRIDLHIHNLEVQRMEKVDDWYAMIKQSGWLLARSGAAAPGAAPGVMPPAATPPGGTPPTAPAGGPAPGGATPAAGGGPTGPGWIVQLTGYHDHNFAQATTDQGAVYVGNTLIANLERDRVLLPTGKKKKDAKGEETDEDELDFVSMKDLGISCPVLIDPQPVREEEIPDLSASPASTGAGGGPGPASRGIMGAGFRSEKSDDQVKMIKVRRFHFVVQFCWQPVLPSERAKKKAEKEKAEQKPTDATASPAGKGPG
jgi:type IV pilus assembly protein PilM